MEHSQPRRPSPSLPLTQLTSTDRGWSPADEVAALDEVWASLCQDAAVPAPALQLPVISRSGLRRDADRRPERQILRRRNDADRNDDDRIAS